MQFSKGDRWVSTKHIATMFGGMSGVASSGGFRRESRQYRRPSAAGYVRRSSEQRAQDLRRHSRVSVTSNPDRDVIMPRRPTQPEVLTATTSGALPVDTTITMPEEDIPMYGKDGSINITYKILKEIVAEMDMKKVKGETAEFIPSSYNTQQIDYIFHVIEVSHLLQGRTDIAINLFLKTEIYSSIFSMISQHRIDIDCLATIEASQGIIIHGIDTVVPWILRC